MDFLEVACLKRASWLMTFADLGPVEVVEGALSFSCNFFQFEERSAGAMMPLVAGLVVCGGDVEGLAEGEDWRLLMVSWWSLWYFQLTMMVIDG